MLITGGRETNDERTHRVLVVDDAPEFIEILVPVLEREGYRTEVARDGEDAIETARTFSPDVIVLDLGLPKLDGVEVCRKVRAFSDAYVLMLTARGDETDRVVGLEIGADDYVAKPFSPRELLARIKAVLRRARPEVAGERIVAGDIVIDVPGRVVTREGELVELTGLEFDLLCALARRPGRVVARDALLSEAGRGDVIVGERTVDVHISHLRQKLGDDPRSPRLIKTVRGVGYVLAKEKS